MSIIYWMGYTISKLIGILIFGMKVIDRENAPREGAFLLAGNHISYYDPPLYGCFLPRAIHFLGKKELFENKLLKPIIVRTNAHPINRKGFDRKAIKTSLDLLDNGQGMLIFPEGTRSKTDKFLPPKAGIGLLAKKAGVPIVPAYIHGTNKLKDCFWRREQMGLIYGSPISSEEIKKFEDGREGYQALADEIMNRITKLRNQYRALYPGKKKEIE